MIPSHARNFQRNFSAIVLRFIVRENILIVQVGPLERASLRITSDENSTKNNKMDGGSSNYCDWIVIKIVLKYCRQRIEIFKRFFLQFFVWQSTYEREKNSERWYLFV